MAGGWPPVTLVSGGHGRLHATVDHRFFLPGNVDLRVSAADQAGGTFRQTTLGGSTVTGS